MIYQIIYRIKERYSITPFCDILKFVKLEVLFTQATAAHDWYFSYIYSYFSLYSKVQYLTTRSVRAPLAVNAHGRSAAILKRYCYRNPARAIR